MRKTPAKCQLRLVRSVEGAIYVQEWKVESEKLKMWDNISACDDLLDKLIRWRAAMMDCLVGTLTKHL